MNELEPGVHTWAETVGVADARLEHHNATDAALRYLIDVQDRDLKELRKQVKETNDAMGASEAAGTKGSKGVSRLGGAAKLAGAAVVGGLVMGLKSSVSAALESEKSAMRLGQAFDSVKASARQRKAAQDAVNATSRRAALDDEELSDVLANLTRSTGDVKKATEGMSLAAEIARGRNVPLATAAKAVEKAMLGQATGMRRLGVVVPEVTSAYDGVKGRIAALQDQLKGAEGPQKAAIEAAIENEKRQLKNAKALDKAATAQNAIGAAQEQFAGSSKRYGDTAAGAQARFGVAIENVQEAIGAGLLPVLTSLLGVGLKVLTWMEDNQTAAVAIMGALAGLTVAVFAINVATKVYSAGVAAATAAQWLWNAALSANPIGLVILALVALGVGLFVLWKKSETFREIVTGAFDAVKDVASGVASFITKDVPAAFNSALSWVRRHWPEIATIISGPFAPIVMLATDAFGVRSAITGAFTTAKNWVKERIDDIVGFVSALPGRLAAFASDLVSRGTGPITAAFDAVRAPAAKVKDLVEWLRDSGGAAVQRMANLAKKPLEALGNGFETVWGWVKKVKDGIEWLVEKIPKMPKLPDVTFWNGKEPSQAERSSRGVIHPNASISPKLWGALGQASAFGLALSSGYRPGDDGDHGKFPAHAIDVSNASSPTPQMTRYAIWAASYPGTKDVIYAGLPFWIDNGRVASWAGWSDLYNSHLNHVHHSVFDRGGWLMPGLTLAYNGTGVPERVHGPGGGGDTYITLIVQGNVQTEHDLIAAIHDGLERESRRNAGLRITTAG